MTTFERDTKQIQLSQHEDPIAESKSALALDIVPLASGGDAVPPSQQETGIEIVDVDISLGEGMLALPFSPTEALDSHRPDAVTSQSP